MRNDYAAFRALGAQIVVVTRHDEAEMRSYWDKEKLPFLGISDPDGTITDRYGQQWKLLSLGRMPAQVFVDCQAKVARSHYGKSMADILPNREVLASLQEIRSKSCAGTATP